MILRQLQLAQQGPLPLRWAPPCQSAGARGHAARLRPAGAPAWSAPLWSCYAARPQSCSAGKAPGVGLERPEQWCCREALRAARCAPLPSRALQAGHFRVDCAYPKLAVRLSMLCKPAASLKHQGSHSSSPVVLCRQGSKASTEAHPPVTFQTPHCRSSTSSWRGVTMEA